MELYLSLIPEAAEGCEILSAEENRLCVRVTEKVARLKLPALTERVTAAHTLLTAVVSQDQMEIRQIAFRLSDHEGKARFYYCVKLQTTVTADLLFRTKYLDGGLHFPPMECGTLKSACSGSILPEEVAQLSLELSGAGTTFTIENLRLTDVEPPRRTDTHVMCDEFGQWNARDWPGKTHDLAELRHTLEAELAAVIAAEDDNLDAYGGDRRLKLAEPSDRFRTAKKDGKWWLVTPEGNAFFSTGVFGVYPGEYGWVHGNEDYIGALPSKDGEFAEAWMDAEDDELFRRKFSGRFPADTQIYAFATANLIRVWGKSWRENWTKLTAARMKRMSLMTLSMFSDPQFIRDSGIPYVIMLKRYPTTEKKIWHDLPDVFDPAFTEAAEVYAAQLAEHAENPRFIGYFMNNEPTFAWETAERLSEKVLEVGASLHSHAAFKAWLREKYGDIAAFNAAWEMNLASFDGLDTPIFRASERSDTVRADLAAFSTILVRRWAEIPSKVCRNIAPNRLNLGMRFAGITPLVLGTVDLFDVYSFNRYGLDPTEKLDEVAAKADLPLLIGEFHFGATDAGLPSGGMVTFPIQAERAEAYRNYMEAAAAHPACVGAHWFAWNDQPLWGRYDCENFGFGMVDICGRAYPLFTETVSAVNREIMEKRINLRG
ncbi:MAG: beta-galactosidase [Clostridia bacterium]|nr:beta-galactosidase [Clostridia bacterium]